MVRIRLARAGCKNRPFYQVVVADQRSPQGGRLIEHLGTFDPSKNEGGFDINTARLSYWKEKGAQCTDVVADLLRKRARAAATPKS